MVLVAGGENDPNIVAVLNRLRERNLAHEALLVGPNRHPRITWDLDHDALSVDSRQLAPEALFIRHDVFTNLEDGRPESARRALSWFTVAMGWALAHPRVRLLNRASAQWMTNKLHVLHLARQAGLKTPATRVTNDLQALAADAEAATMVVKPVIDGGYCQDLGPVLQATSSVQGAAAAPATVQHRLITPEQRIYAIGGRHLAFRLESQDLDYRVHNRCRIAALPEPAPGLSDGLARLMSCLRMDYGAADFKTCPETGELLFLELNSAPMFARFDTVANGALVDALLAYLVR